MRSLFVTTLLLSLSTTLLIAQASERVVYKQLDTANLYLDIYYPTDYDTTQTHPAIVFFFGGGWKSGTTAHFEPQAAYFASRGMVCFLADYRTATRHHTTPFESLKDAKSAMRFIRSHSEEFHIDTARIVGAGGSAGGHLAAATALISGYNEATDDLSVSCAPNALVLFNPVIDNGPGGYGYERIGQAYKDFSPLHNLKAGVPPTIFFLGTEDQLIPVATAEYYQMVMEKVESRCDLMLFEREEHGFFNNKYPDNYQKTVAAADAFLVSMGYLKSIP